MLCIKLHAERCELCRGCLGLLLALVCRCWGFALGLACVKLARLVGNGIGLVPLADVKIIIKVNIKIINHAVGIVPVITFYEVVNIEEDGARPVGQALVALYIILVDLHMIGTGYYCGIGSRHESNADLAAHACIVCCNAKFTIRVRGFDIFADTLRYVLGAQITIIIAALKTVLSVKFVSGALRGFVRRLCGGLVVLERSKKSF